jgi:hypothetical protein
MLLCVMLSSTWQGITSPSHELCQCCQGLVNKHKVVCFVEIQCTKYLILNPIEANSKCSASTIHTMCGSGTPLMESCSKYSGSTIHTCMKLEPPIQRAASKVYLIKKPIEANFKCSGSTIHTMCGRETPS